MENVCRTLKKKSYSFWFKESFQFLFLLQKCVDELKKKNRIKRSCIVLKLNIASCVAGHILYVQCR